MITTVRTVGGEASTAFLTARNVRQRARTKRLRVLRVSRRAAPLAAARMCGSAVIGSGGHGDTITKKMKDAFGVRAHTSRSDPHGLHRAEAFWNSRSHGLATVEL